MTNQSKPEIIESQLNEGAKDMAIKIGTGRGKKGDGATINRTTKVKTRGNIRNVNGFSNQQLEALLANPNSRNKDVPKIKRAMARRARGVVENWTPEQRSNYLITSKVVEIQEALKK